MTNPPFYLQAEARSNNRAFVFWALAVISSGVLSLLEGGGISTWAVTLLLPLAPASISLRRRAALLVLALVSVWYGAYTVILVIPLALITLKLHKPAISGFLALAATAYLYPHAQSLPAVNSLNLPLASFGFLLLPAWISTLVLFYQINLRGRLALILLPILSVLLIELAVGNWLGPSLFTDPVFRLFTALLPIIYAAHISDRLEIRSLENHSLFFFSFPALVGAVLVALIPVSKINNVTFDESHGKWETVLSSFGPEDFGLSANYTYSLLFHRAKNIVGDSSVFLLEGDKLPPTKDSVFVVKMPAIAFSNQFSAKLATWVSEGGRLVIVADHTDLYDTTQNINSFLLPFFGTEINSDAVYNAVGMLATPRTDIAGVIAGRVDGTGMPLPWQTGASMKRLPLNGIELATYGLSFSEPGDYSGSNRFGAFSPDLENRYYNHSAIVAFGHGKGAVGIVLDSTPWSNFSIFREQYVDLFRTLLGALSNPFQLNILGWSGAVLALLAVLNALYPSRIIMSCGGLFFGTALAAGISISNTTLSPQIDGRDFGIRIVSGEKVKLEFLKKILLPGERNYARIISSLGKYELMPIASTPGSEIPKLNRAGKWLLIEPMPEQLPNYSDTLKHLERGGNLSILFAPEQAASPEIVKWLSSFNLFTQRNIGLMVSDSSRAANNSLIGGRALALGREVRVTTAALPTSMLNDYESDQYIQTYTLRPTLMPRTSGLLSIGFSADQFSDDAVGEVWEGIYPSSIGMQREQLLAASLKGLPRPELMPNWLIRAKRFHTSQLHAFLVAENGTTKLSGVFNKETLNDPVLRQFHHLRDQAYGFILDNCPQQGILTRCSDRLLGDDMIEWVVSWRSTDDGKIEAMELLHERRMSGLGSTWNIVFGK